MQNEDSFYLNLSEAELIKASCDGDDISFSYLVDRHQKTLMNFLISMNVSFIEAEDISQDVWVKIYDFRFKYVEKAKFTTFLYDVAKKKVIDAYRKKTRFGNFISLFKGHKQAMNVQLEKEQLNDKVHQVEIEDKLNSLSAPFKEVLVLRFYEGLSYQEISDLLRIPLGTVKSRMNKALQAMKESK